MTTAADLDQHFIQTVGALPGGPARPDGAAPVRAGSGLDGDTLLAIFDAQAQSRSTCPGLGGLIEHVAAIVDSFTDLLGPAASAQQGGFLCSA